MTKMYEFQKELDELRKQQQERKSKLPPPPFLMVNNDDEKGEKVKRCLYCNSPLHRRLNQSRCIDEGPSLIFFCHQCNNMKREIDERQQIVKTKQRKGGKNVNKKM